MAATMVVISRNAGRAHPVTMVAFEGAALLDIAGPLQVFSSANSLSGRECYSPLIATLDGAPAATEGGIRLHADLSLRDTIPQGSLAVAGGNGVDGVIRNSEFIERLSAALRQQKRIISICSGSLLLAQTGILDGRTASCHWSREDEVRRRFPKVKWDLSRIYTTDDNIYTSAGVTTGIDLALKLVELDYGQDLSLAIARELIIYLRRSGASDQLSVPLRSQFASSPRIRALCDAVSCDPGKDWRVSEMAAHANMTERSLHRHFLQELGVSPSHFVESIRLDLAKSLIEQGNEPLDRIAERSGFQNSQNLRRSFVKHLGATPSQYQNNHMDKRVVRF